MIINFRKSFNRKAYSLSAFFNYLIDVYGYPKNPIKQLTPLKTDKKSTTISLTRAEIIDFLEFTKGRRRESEAKSFKGLSLYFSSSQE